MHPGPGRTTPPAVDVPQIPTGPATARRSAEYRVPTAVPLAEQRTSGRIAVPQLPPEEELGEIDSLQQILEPDRTGPWLDGSIEKKPPPPRVPPLKALIIAGVVVAVLIVILVAKLVGGHH
jgi:hypothetical protein